MSTSFWFSGWQYYQQGQRCAKPGCACAAGELHGPYWYRRRRTGKKEYVGRELDRRLLQLVEQRDGLRSAVEAHIAQLQRDAVLLQALLDGRRPLDLAEKHYLEQLGYAMLLDAQNTFE